MISIEWRCKHLNSGHPSGITHAQVKSEINFGFISEICKIRQSE